MFYILVTPKSVLLQTVKPQMKCGIMPHFISLYMVRSGKKDFRDRYAFPFGFFSL